LQPRSRRDTRNFLAAHLIPQLGSKRLDGITERIRASVSKLLDPNAYLIVLLGGEAGLRLGEILALEWGDVDLGKRQLCIQRSDWRGHVTEPKSGRLRHVPMTVRLAAALREHRQLRPSEAGHSERRRSESGRGEILETADLESAISNPSLI
jgi:integrase